MPFILKKEIKTYHFWQVLPYPMQNFLLDFLLLIKCVLYSTLLYSPHSPSFSPQFKWALKGKVLNVDDVARAALYLASDEANNISGLNLLVDGRYSVVNPNMMDFLSAFTSQNLNTTSGWLLHGMYNSKSLYDFIRYVMISNIVDHNISNYNCDML